jgi:hypothetical protein
MPFRTILNFAGGALKTASEFYEDVTETVRSITPEPIGQALDVLAETVERGVARTPVGVAERGAAASGQLVEQATGSPMLGLATGFTLGMVSPGPPTFAKGSAAFGKQFVSRSREVEKLSSKIADYRAIGKTSRIGKTEAKLSSAQSNVLPFTPEDPKAYPPNLTAAKEIVTSEQLKRQTTDTLHLHHKLPKGMSAAFFDRMDQFISKGVAGPDDLADMADEATKAGVRTGDARSNILAIADRPHTELHTEMRAMGSGMFGRMELGKKELMAAMKEAKDPTSLKALWKAWLTDDAKYLVETAEVWEPLGDLLKEVRNMK